MIQASRLLRRNCTTPEQRLWQYFRDKRFCGLKFRRQYVIKPYIVDFICLSQGLIIEVDGSQHLDNKEYDAHRTLYFETLGYRVIRFWNHDVLQKTTEVLEVVYNEIFNES